MKRCFYLLMFLILICPLMAQYEDEKNSSFGVFAAWSELGDDFDGVDSGTTGGIRFRLEKWRTFRLGFELESSFYDGVDAYALNAVPEFRWAEHFAFLIGGGIAQYDIGFDDSFGLNALIGFAVPINNHFEVFARYDYFVGGETGNGQINFSNNSLNVSMLRAGLHYIF